MIVKVKYYLSMGYYDQEGIVGGNYGKSNYNRLTLRSNTNMNVLDANRQTIMFSATMPDKIQTLARNILYKPVEVKIAVSKPAEKIQQSAYVCYDTQKLPILRHIFTNEEQKRSLTFQYSYANGRKSMDAMPSVLSGLPMMVEPFFLTPATLNDVQGVPSMLKPLGYYSCFFHGGHNISMGFIAFAGSNFSTKTSEIPRISTKESVPASAFLSRLTHALKLPP